MKEKTLGIIGYGRFGKLMHKYLKEDFEIRTYDKNIKEKNTEENLKKITQSDIVVIAVPISEIEDTLKKIKKHIKQKTLFIDVCSVKEHPAKLMKKYLPKNVEILATHPMFGPDSAKTTLKKRKIVICPINITSKTLNKTKKYLREKGLEIIEMTPKEHDEITAKTQLLAHYISRTLIELNIKKNKHRHRRI